MSVIYSDAWYEDMKTLINGSDQLAKMAPKTRTRPPPESLWANSTLRKAERRRRNGSSARRSSWIPGREPR